MKYIDIYMKYRSNTFMAREWISFDPPLRILTALRAVLRLAAGVEVQFRSVNSRLLRRTRTMGTINYPAIKSKNWCAFAWSKRRRECTDSWDRIVRRTVQTGEPSCSVCHAGLQQFSMPVFHGGKIAGMLLSSQPLHPSEGGSFAKSYSQVMGIPPSRKLWLAAYGLMTSQPTSRQLEILRLCRAMTESAMDYSSPRTRGTMANRENLSTQAGAPSPGRNGTGPAQAAPWGGIVDRARGLLETNFSAKISRHSLASSLKCSPSTLSRRFKREVGESLPSYLNRLRLRQAGELLTSSALSITEISRQLGFGTYRNFFHVFNRAVGMSPRLFRQSRWKELREEQDRILEETGGST